LSRRLIASVSASLILLGLLGGVGWWVQARERDRREAIIVATAKTVAAVRADLRSADYQKRHSAAIKILELGPLAKGAVPDLSAALKAEAKRLPAEYKRSENMLGTEVAPFARALWSIGEPAEACLLDLLNEREIGPRLATVWALSDSYWTAQTGPSPSASSARGSVIRTRGLDFAPAMHSEACGLPPPPRTRCRICSNCERPTPIRRSEPSPGSLPGKSRLSDEPFEDSRREGRPIAA
jgi:hypothetical protein